MATVSSTFSNFLSFLFPTKQPPPPPPPQQFNLPPPPSPSSSSHTLKTKPSHTPSPPSSCCSSDELSSVICPSLAYSNTLFFVSPYGEEVEEATKRNSRTRLPLQKTLAQNRQDVPTTKKEEDEDNLDLPEEDFPY